MCLRIFLEGGAHKGLSIPMSGPMSVQCRLMSAHVGFTDIGSDVGLGQTDRRRVLCGGQVRMSGPMSGLAKPTSDPTWMPLCHVGSDVGLGQPDMGCLC